MSEIRVEYHNKDIKEKSTDKWYANDKNTAHDDLFGLVNYINSNQRYQNYVNREIAIRRELFNKNLELQNKLTSLYIQIGELQNQQNTQQQQQIFQQQLQQEQNIQQQQQMMQQQQMVQQQQIMQQQMMMH